MSTEPIFDQLQAEFVQNSQFCRLQIGPPIGEGFEQIEIVDEYLGTIGYINRLIVEELEQPVVEVKDSEPKLELDGLKIDGTTASKRLYIVEGTPELINLSEIPVEPSEMVSGLVLAEADFEQTVTIPVIDNNTPKPPSAINDVQSMPLVTEEISHVTPIKRSQPTHHKKISAYGTSSWFAKRAA